jgi:outer membrane protein
LDSRLQGIIDRELSQVDSMEMELAQTPPPREVEEALAGRMEELADLTPAPTGSPIFLDLGADLNGQKQQQRPIDLQDVVKSTIQNNLNLQSARLLPAIEREEVINAEAVFDVVLGAGYSFTKTRAPNQQIDVSGSGQTPSNINSSITNLRNNDAEVSLSKNLTSGGLLKLSTDIIRANNQGSGDVQYTPNPYWNPSLTLDLSQPLLRGFGDKVNLATVAIMRKQEQEAIESLRQELIETVASTETAYWNLALAWRNLAIQVWLVEAGIKMRDIVGKRRGYDASLADWAQAVATVEQRLADVITIKLNVKEASDILKVLMNDPRFPLSGEVVLSPIDEVVHAPITIDFRAALITAVSMRPAVRNAIYQIDIAEINEVVADNARLPELDLQAQVSSTGMSSNFSRSYYTAEKNVNSNNAGTGAFGGDFISYMIGLAFEYPLGNRAAEAEFRIARLQRSSAMVGYRTAIQDSVLDVKTAMRNVVANAELIQATRVSRLAAAEALRALEVERDTVASLTPVFLNLLFSNQVSLASARVAEFQAIVNFNISVADLYKAMGTTLDMHNIGMEHVDEHAEWDPSIESGPAGAQ